MLEKLSESELLNRFTNKDVPFCEKQPTIGFRPKQQPECTLNSLFRDAHSNNGRFVVYQKDPPAMAVVTVAPGLFPPIKEVLDGYIPKFTKSTPISELGLLQQMVNLGIVDYHKVKETRTYDPHIQGYFKALMASDSSWYYKKRELKDNSEWHCLIVISDLAKPLFEELFKLKLIP